ncbi:hypothetical protein CoNPh11_CDS0215 [Staphylococcus phage S-CoN_Ph11]|nr:hypothetical protein CoNPh11_CDS0215 [Staphylococcus phage S-CoN_Ph11]
MEVEHRKIFYRDVHLTHLAGATFRFMPETSELIIRLLSKSSEETLVESEGKDNITDRPNEEQSDNGVEYDFDALMKETAELGKKLQKDGKTEERNKVIEDVLGNGRKVKDLDESQAEILSVLVDKLKEIA